MTNSNHESGGFFLQLLETLAAVDPGQIRAEVESVHAAYPNLNKEELAWRIFRSAQWKASAVGAATGLPANPAAMVPAAAADLAGILTIELRAAARVAELYEPGFLNNAENRWVLFAPVIGMDLVSQGLREVGIELGKIAAREALRELCTSGALRTVAIAFAKALGTKATMKALATKTLPLVGAVIGSTWNFAEVSFVRVRTIAFFAQQTPPATATSPIGLRAA